MASVAGHFGEWLQGRLGPEGPLALVTVACPALSVRADFTAGERFDITQTPQILPQDQALAFLAAIHAARGHYTLTADMPPGGGAGASTAALLALAEAGGVAPATVTAVCLAAEGASDPLMLPAPDAVLWAPREGRVLADLAPLPQAEIIGGFWGPPTPTDPADQVFPDVSDLAAQIKNPVPLQTLAEIASSSATRTTALRGPAKDPTASLAQSLGALGWLRAHTGSARGLIFAPGAAPADAQETLRAAGFAATLRFFTGGRP
ncbi:propanediol utilization protein [Paracoccaceae bacterium GXU_MW_L88]